ncbi:MAG: toxin-antitoxin system HicB family antitoxin [Anaerolineae bacterium]|nr:toxin-antitoxin system HicB family antitoxin [Anaerolineae bacterium]
MGRFTLRMPKTLHNTLEILAKDEGISLNQYIVYTLTQKVTAETLDIEPKEKPKGLTPEQMEFLSNVELTPSKQIKEQQAAYEAMLSRLGPKATDEEVERYLSEREQGEPEAELEPEAIIRLKERIAQVKQSA